MSEDLASSWTLTLKNVQGKNYIFTCLEQYLVSFHTYSTIFHAISILLECEVPYNIVMLRGTPFSDAHISSPPSLIRTILVPRKPALGMYIHALVYLVLKKAVGNRKTCPAFPEAVMVCVL